MKPDKKHIEELLLKFFAGGTSNVEEEELYQYFSADKIDKSLEQYRDLFRYFQSDLEKELNNIELQENRNSEKLKKNKNRRNLRYILVAAAVAASLLILFLVNPFITNASDPYEGSYVLINGDIAKNVDFEKVEQKILCQVDRVEKEYQQLIDNANNKTEKYEKISQSID